MEQLPFAHYLALATYCVRLYNVGQLSDNLLAIALGYTLAGDHPIVKNHTAPVVQKLFTQILYPTPTLIQQVKRITDGSLLKEWSKKEIARHFKEEKHPLPFQETLVQLTHQAFIGWHVSTEGLLGSNAFMMLYEHADYYIENVDFVRIWLDQRNVFVELDPCCAKYHPLDAYYNIMINTIRKLDQQKFLKLIMDLNLAYKAKDPEKCGIVLPLDSWNDWDFVYNQYDTLALKPYPIDVNQYHNLPKSMQKKFTRYMEHLPERIYQQQLYGIPAYDEKKLSIGLMDQGAKAHGAPTTQATLYK